jgi:hypothetical protein
MKNTVIVRKTVGELKRAQLNVFYFESNLVKSAVNPPNSLGYKGKTKAEPVSQSHY